MPNLETFSLLCHKLQVEPDRKGECWIACPFCGKDSDNGRKPSHFSFSQRGYKCFVCGASGGLLALKRHLNIGDFVPYRVERKQKPQEKHRPFPWQKDAKRILGEFEAHPYKIDLWQEYRFFSFETIRRWHMGAGVLPSCRCHHIRLIYPAFNANGQIVAFRGRSIECDCAKWLQSAGSRVTLWGGSLVQYGKDQVVIVCESPVDAMLAMQEEPGIVAVSSTGGAGTWRDSWTKHLKRQEPARVIVWYDNDLAGTPNQETREALAKEWREKHPEIKKLPRQNGPWLYNKLARAGLPVVLYQWPEGTPAKQDLSVELMR